MRTVFVNPGKPKKRRRNTGKGSASLARVQNAYLAGVKAGKPKRRKRNAGVVPFVKASNPLILQNPPRKRRRRRNPTLNFNMLLKRSVEYGGGSAIGTAVNVMALNRIPNVWARNGSRMAAAVLGSMVLRNLSGNERLAAAAAGSALYPMWQEIASQVLTGMPGATEADLDMLAADLEDVLSEVDHGDLVDDYDTVLR